MDLWNVTRKCVPPLMNAIRWTKNNQVDAVKHAKVIFLNIYTRHNSYLNTTLLFCRWRCHTECEYKGVNYRSGDEWSHPDDPCTHYKCVSGVITESIQKCYTQCLDPKPPREGQCCPTCLGKLLLQYSK